MLIFIQIVMEGHIIAATLKHFKMENCESGLPATLTCELQSSEGRSAFHKHILNMLIGLINLPIRPGRRLAIMDLVQMVSLLMQVKCSH